MVVAPNHSRRAPAACMHTCMHTEKQNKITHPPHPGCSSPFLSILSPVSHANAHPTLYVVLATSLVMSLTSAATRFSELPVSLLSPLSFDHLVVAIVETLSSVQAIQALPRLLIEHHNPPPSGV